LYVCAAVAWSIMPTLAGRVLSAFGSASACPQWPPHRAAQLLDANKVALIERIEPLVTKRTESEIARLESRFAGVRG